MKAIEVISIPVTDQARAKAFYLKLGFCMIAEAPFDNGKTWVQLGFPNQTTTITLVNWWPFYETKMKAGSLHGIFLETENMETEMHELSKQGIEIQMMNDTNLGTFIQILDPDGNALVIHQNK